MTELLDEPRDVPPGELIKFRIFQDFIDAQLMRANLESQGIPCFIPNENTLTLNPLYTNALGGVQLWIRSEHVAEAQRILEEIDNQPYTDESDVAIACPKCHSTRLRAGYKSVKSVGSFISWLFAFMTGTYPVYSSSLFKCKDCGAEFETNSGN